MEDKKEKFLLTGLRLLYILKFLSEGACSKTKLLNYIKEKLKLESYSQETLKLDINSLIKSGFQLERKGKRENFRYELKEKPQFLKFNLEETEIFSFLKNAVMETFNFKEILEVRNFFYSNKNLFLCCGELLDFEGFNYINEKIVEMSDDLIQKKLPAKIVYSSPIQGRKEFIGLLEKIIIRNKKLYLTLYSEFAENKITLRLDKIKNIEAIDQKINKKEKVKTSFKYAITKDFFENNPLLPTENAVIKNDFEVEIENFEEDVFFVVQRLLMLGKDCIKIYDEKIKEKVLKILKDTLGVYEKCQIQ